LFVAKNRTAFVGLRKYTRRTYRRRESGLEMDHRKILILESTGTGCCLKQRHNNGKSCIFVSIEVLP
jgi:hypothetical protein